MRQMCLNMVYELAQEDSRVFFVGSDLGVGTLDKFKNNLPDRFLMEGVSRLAKGPIRLLGVFDCGHSTIDRLVDRWLEIVDSGDPVLHENSLCRAAGV